MRFGLIGTGGIGHIRAQALNGMKNCELSAVTDVDKERARALASSFSNKISVFDDCRQMLASDSVDAVIVSTPPQFHEEITVSALSPDTPDCPSLKLRGCITSRLWAAAL